MEYTTSTELLEEARIPRRFWRGICKPYFGRQDTLQKSKEFFTGVVEKNVHTSCSGIIYCGAARSGKTMHMCATLLTCMAHGTDVVYTDAYDIVESCFSLDMKGLWFSCLSIPVLGIDRVGNVLTPPQKRVLLNVLTVRSDKMLPTLLVFEGENVVFGEGDFSEELNDRLVHRHTFMIAKCVLDALALKAEEID